MNTITELPKTAKVFKRAKAHFLDSFPSVSIWHIKTEFFRIEILAYAKPSKMYGMTGKAGIRIYGEGNNFLPMIEGSATGYGYDKISSAVSSSARAMLESIGKFVEWNIMDKMEYNEITANSQTIEVLQALAKIGAGGTEQIRNIPNCICIIGG